jgi:hypothetical protein
MVIGGMKNYGWNPCKMKSINYTIGKENRLLLQNCVINQGSRAGVSFVKRNS